MTWWVDGDIICVLGLTCVTPNAKLEIELFCRCETSLFVSSFHFECTKNENKLSLFSHWIFHLVPVYVNDGGAWFPIQHQSSVLIFRVWRTSEECDEYVFIFVANFIYGHRCNWILMDFRVKCTAHTHKLRRFQCWKMMMSCDWQLRTGSSNRMTNEPNKIQYSLSVYGVRYTCGNRYGVVCLYSAVVEWSDYIISLVMRTNCVWHGQSQYCSSSIHPSAVDFPRCHCPALTHSHIIFRLNWSYSRT